MVWRNSIGINLGVHEACAHTQQEMPGGGDSSILSSFVMRGLRCMMPLTRARPSYLLCTRSCVLGSPPSLRERAQMSDCLK